MNCQYFSCDKEERGIPIIHDALITPISLHLCQFHAAELIGYLNARDALALEKFVKRGNLGTVIIKDSMVTLLLKHFRKL
jgi:hypothetical protein